MLVYKRCECCGALWEFNEDVDFIFFEPYPHFECPNCSSWIAAF